MNFNNNKNKEYKINRFYYNYNVCHIYICQYTLIILLRVY